MINTYTEKIHIDEIKTIQYIASVLSKEEEDNGLVLTMLTLQVI